MFEATKEQLRKVNLPKRWEEINKKTFLTFIEIWNRANTLSEYHKREIAEINKIRDR